MKTTVEDIAHKYTQFTRGRAHVHTYRERSRMKIFANFVGLGPSVKVLSVN